MSGSFPGAAIGAELVMERHRQVAEEGYTPERDDTYQKRELPLAAAAYAARAGNSTWATILGLWPWGPSTLKATKVTPRRALIKAGALIIAAIEQIDRAAEREQGQ